MKQEQFEKWYRAICRDIYVFCRLMNFEPTWQQRQLFDAVQAGHRKIAVKSGQGPGKTTASAILGMWRLLCRPGAKLIVVAPTMAQCKDVWLAECERLLMRADKFIQGLFQVQTTTLGVCGFPPRQWGAILRSSNKSETAQGQHAESMDVICEEASGVSREIIEQYKGTLSNQDALFLQIGNPNTCTCAFYDCFFDAKWKCFTWNAEETPASRWFNPQRNKDLEEEFGRDSNVYRIRVRGEFPLADGDCIISEAELRKCMDTSNRLAMASTPDPQTGIVRKQIGLDFARYGGDENCAALRQGTALLQVWARPNCEPTEAIKQAFTMQHDRFWSDDEAIFVADASGIGQGVLGRFHDADKKTHEFHNHGSAYRSDKYHDKITEAWFCLRDLVRSENCFILDDRQLVRQLTSRRYEITEKGKLKVESKEKYRRRKENEENSPDRADAVVECFYPHASVGGRVARAS